MKNNMFDMFGIDREVLNVGFLCSPVGPGFYPTVMHQYQMHQEDPDLWGVDHPSSIVHGAEAMLKIKGSRPRKKYNLMAQVIPLYGFGIFLYIFYIIYKVTLKY